MRPLNKMIVTVFGFLGIVVLLSALTAPYFREAEKQSAPLSRTTVETTRA